MRAAEDYVGVLLLTVTSTLVTYSNLYTYKIMGGCFFFFYLSDVFVEAYVDVATY